VQDNTSLQDVQFAAKIRTLILFLDQKQAMKCTIRVYLKNDDFSQEYADERYNGEESEMNRKFEWEDELVITQDVAEVQMESDSNVVLQGQLPGGSAFNEDVPLMRKFIFRDAEGTPVAQLACSEVLYDSHEEKKDEGLEFKLFLKDREPLSNPIPGIYIAARHFPKSLILE
jgi:hypothetical protein